MTIFFTYLIVCFDVLALFSLQSAASNHVGIGAIIDGTSRAGREANVSIQIALDDVNSRTNQSFVLHIMDSLGDPATAALQAKRLTDSKEVRAILGPHTWQEVSEVLEVSSRSNIPILSLADTTLVWATDHWPFLVQASASDQQAQMKSVAAIVQSWDWHRVTVIYEDDADSAFSGVIPDLLDSLREVGVEISHLVPFQLIITSSWFEKLMKLKRDQCRVFIVHASIRLATHLFQKADEIQLMEKNYVWIVTNTIADTFHSLDVTTISSMKGVLGVKKYFPETGLRFVEFQKRFRKKFNLEYPDEEKSEPGIFAVEAYDAVWAVAMTMDGRNIQVTNKNPKKSDTVSLVDFNGMTGRVHFFERKLTPLHIFEIVNVLGKSYRELGIWSEGLGFTSKTVSKANYSNSMENLGPIFWPGQSSYTPRGWNISSNTASLRIGVPAESLFKQFVKVLQDPHTNRVSCTGFAIDIFNEVMARLPYYVPYKFIPFNGTYDHLVEQVYLKNVDGVAGDVAPLASRCKHAEFTHIYSNSALTMIVPVQSKMPHKAWLFMRPFTKAMWLLILAITIYNGFVIWLIERNHSPRLRGSSTDQAGILIWLSFTTLFSLNGGRLHSNLSRMAIVVWLFVALIITQSYTASLTSMLTVQKLEPTVSDIETLKLHNSVVGYGKGAFVAKYLEEVLGFKPENIKSFSTPEEYAQALKTGQIAAGFLNGSYVKLFLAKYCKSFTVAGPTYKVGGFGFAFPRGSPMIADVNKALLEVFESGKLRELEDKMIGSERCVEVDTSNDDEVSLSLNSFWILFALTVGTTTCALIIFTLDGLKIKRRFSKKVSDVEMSQAGAELHYGK